ncbi:hypothetical protein ACFV8T_00415 [Streptomyces sp. NPDC059832]|uniref:hypothetical protein n=1 Tax=Streptomyces sp. NPDC059832 TaxID=3346966 RepID=UPI00365C10C3
MGDIDELAVQGAADELDVLAAGLLVGSGSSWSDPYTRRRGSPVMRSGRHRPPGDVIHL